MLLWFVCCIRYVYYLTISLVIVLIFFFPFYFFLWDYLLGWATLMFHVSNKLHFLMRWRTYWQNNKKGYQAGDRGVSGLGCPLRSSYAWHNVNLEAAYFSSQQVCLSAAFWVRALGFIPQLSLLFFLRPLCPLVLFTITEIWMKRGCLSHPPFASPPPPESCEIHSGLPYCVFPRHINPIAICKASLEKCPQLWVHHYRGNLFPDRC